MNHPSLSEEDLNTLGFFLEKEASAREALDFFATHGLITALIISPISNQAEDAWKIIFEETPHFEYAKQEQEIKQHIQSLWQEIEYLLGDSETFPLPCECALNQHEEELLSPLESWAQGFVEGVMSQQDAWFQNTQYNIAEYLLPLHFASGFFCDEPDMVEIANNPQLTRDVCNAVPEAVSDLYLAFRT